MSGPGVNNTHHQLRHISLHVEGGARCPTCSRTPLSVSECCQRSACWWGWQWVAPVLDSPPQSVHSPAPPVSTPTLSLRGQQAAPAMKGTGTARRNNKKSTASNKEEKCICEICTCGWVVCSVAPVDGYSSAGCPAHPAHRPWAGTGWHVTVSHVKQGDHLLSVPRWRDLSSRLNVTCLYHPYFNNTQQEVV